MQQRHTKKFTKSKTSTWRIWSKLGRFRILVRCPFLECRRTGLAEECQAKAKAKTILARSNGVCVKARAKNIYLFRFYFRTLRIMLSKLSRFVPLSSHCSTSSRFRYAGLDVETSVLEVRRPKTKKSYSLYVYLVYLDFAGFMRHERLLRAMLAAILQAYDKRTHTLHMRMGRLV